MKNKFLARMPAGTSDFFIDSGPHAKNLPNRKVSFRDRAHGRKFHMCTIRSRHGAPTPASKYKLGETPNQLETMTVWQNAFGDIFDERRAAPPAYGRREWSKVVSHLMVFRYVFRY